MRAGQLTPTSEYIHWHLRPFGLVLESVDGCADVRDIAVDELRSLVLKNRFVVLRGFTHLSNHALADYAATWGELLTWEFGTVLDVVVHDQPRNYVFTPGSVPLHWDGAFAQTVPSFQVFQCVRAPDPGAGGETLFCDTNRAWQRATPEQRERWLQAILRYSLPKTAHFGGCIQTPLVDRHPLSGEIVLRFAEPADGETAELNALSVRPVNLAGDAFLDLLHELRVALHDPRVCQVHAWQTGDFLLADNHALLHGRRSFRALSPRHLQRVHVL